MAVKIIEDRSRVNFRVLTLEITRLTLEVRIDWPVKNTTNPQLVHVQTWGVPIVEDLGMAQPVDGRAVEGLVAPKTREEHLVQRPGIVKVLPGRFAGHARKVG